MIRFGELTEDEYFVSHGAAAGGRDFENTGDEPLVVLRYFGPEVNPEAPKIAVDVAESIAQVQWLAPRKHEVSAWSMTWVRDGVVVAPAIREHFAPYPAARSMGRHRPHDTSRKRRCEVYVRRKSIGLPMPGT